MPQVPLEDFIARWSASAAANRAFAPGWPCDALECRAVRVMDPRIAFRGALSALHFA